MNYLFPTYIFFCLNRYSGEFREVGTKIDEAASALWENVSKFIVYLRIFPAKFFPNAWQNQIKITVFEVWQ